MEKLKFSHKGRWCANFSHKGGGVCEFRTPQGGVRNFRTGENGVRNFRIPVILQDREHAIFEKWCKSKFAQGKWCANFAQGTIHSCKCEIGFFQMAITSSFQIQIEHRLKLWTPDFPSFETTYGMHEMDFGKCSKSGCHDCHQECFFSHHVLSLCEKFALSVFMVRNSTERFAYAFWLPCFLCFTSISIFASIIPACTLQNSS